MSARSQCVSPTLVLFFGDLFLPVQGSPSEAVRPSNHSRQQSGRRKYPPSPLLLYTPTTNSPEAPNVRSFLLALILSATIPANSFAQTPATKPLFTIQQAMIPVRDGVHLQTVIIAPADQRTPLPILFRRTPYGVPDKAPEQMPASWVELAKDGYIFVIQNLRGRFKSEGTFELSSQVDLTNPKSTNETTDAYDSIDWLLKNVPNNNGKVGMYGVSYDGLTTALTLLHPHPALKAISEQASPVDQWMNDDDHRYGALRESYDFEYAVMEQSDKNDNALFKFETYDTYQWYLDLGPLSNINAKYLPLLSPRPGPKTRVASHHIPNRLQFLAHLRSLAAQRIQAHQPLSTHRWHSFLHRSYRHRRFHSLPRIHL